MTCLYDPSIVDGGYNSYGFEGGFGGRGGMRLVLSRDGFPVHSTFQSIFFFLLI